MWNFKNRYLGDELMDSASDLDQLQAVFKDIDRCNRYLGGLRINLQALKTIFKKAPQQSYTILDVGCGDGEMLRAVVDWSKKSNFKVKCFGVDLNEAALEIARSKSTEYPEIDYMNINVENWNREKYPVDVVLCTLTLHHIAPENIGTFLTAISKIGSRGVIINELQRSVISHVLFKLFSLIFIRTQMAKTDGAISIKRSFTREDLQSFAGQLPLMDHRIIWHWAFRYLWVQTPKQKIYE